jgi:phage/conjugal plasmid C-4 type zinc finger TraR family protein
VDAADEGQLAEALFREEALAAVGSAPAAAQVVEDGRVVCAECGQPIPLARLAAMPGATRCRECQDDFEG